MILFIFWHVLRNVNSTLSMRLTMHLIEIWGLLYCIDHIHTILENAWKIIPFHGRFAHKRARFWPVKVVNIWVDANSCCSCVYNLKILLNSSSFACSEKSTMNSQIMAKRHTRWLKLGLVNQTGARSWDLYFLKVLPRPWGVQNWY